MSSALFSETNLAMAYGITSDSIRHYRARGLLHPVLVGSVEFYTEADRRRLEIVLKGKRLGFPLTEIEAIIAAHGSHAASTNGSTNPISPPPSAPSREDSATTPQAERDQILSKLEELRQQDTQVRSAIADLQKLLKD